jgi:hypothetical protein
MAGVDPGSALILVEPPRDPEQVQADGIRVKTQAGIVWMALAMPVCTPPPGGACFLSTRRGSNPARRRRFAFSRHRFRRRNSSLTPIPATDVRTPTADYLPTTGQRTRWRVSGDIAPPPALELLGSNDHAPITTSPCQTDAVPASGGKVTHGRNPFAAPPAAISRFWPRYRVR